MLVPPPWWAICVQRTQNNLHSDIVTHDAYLANRRVVLHRNRGLSTLGHYTIRPIESGFK